MSPERPRQDAMEDIAVIGMSCRFPGSATSPEGLWKMMKSKTTAWSEVPSDRMSIDGFYHPDGQRQGSIPFRGAHFLQENIARFDAAFFSATEDEARAMDPQQRLLLETSYEAIENAGLHIEDLRGSDTSVFVGSFVRDYEQVSLRDPHFQPQYAATGTGNAIMANRISYFYDLRGPSVTVDTGCSGSLVAVHQACETLRHGDSSIAFAAGAGVILTPNTMMPMTALNFLSPDGRSFSFDERANGYGRGEGVGFVVLKKLPDALRDNDPVRAVIRGTNICQDGRTPGIIHPSKAAQVANITSVYNKSGLDFDQTAYVECHGTGTKTGDLVELSAVAETLAAKRSPDAPMLIGSLKPNIGHLEGAAGVAGLIKGVLVLEKAQIPPQANFKTGNPNIKFHEWNLKVPTKSSSWPLPGLRRVSINCFGFGGTNAHAIVDEGEFYVKQHHPPGSGMPTTLEEADDLNYEEQSEFPSPQLFTFTAPDQRSVLRLMKTYAEYLQQNPDKYVALEGFNNLAYTLNCRRSQFEWKGFVVANTQAELAWNLDLVTKESLIRSKSQTDGKIAFIFGGQGAQFEGMGYELLRFTVFRNSLYAATEYLCEALGSQFDLLEEIMMQGDDSAIQKPHISQPATTAIQIGLVDLMKACGVNASSAVGHSSGEIAAAYACGMISREDAWTIAFYRGLCANQLSRSHSALRYRGMMCAVAMSESEVQKYLHEEGKSDTVRVACINSPRSVTVSGDANDVFDIADDLKGRGIFHRVLDVQVAYHSHHMQPIESEYMACLQDLPMEFSSPSGIMFSSVTGGRMEGFAQTSKYWTDNLVSPVRFSEAMAAMVKETRPDIILELGPHGAMRGHVADILEGINSGSRLKLAPKYISAMSHGDDEARSALSALGELWSRGHTVDMQGLAKKHTTYGILKTLHDLPAYPWDHSKQFWHESPLTVAYRFRDHGRQDLLGEPTADSLPMEPRWRGFLRVHENPWIRDHQVQKTIIYPASGIIAMVIEGTRQHMKPMADAITGFEVTDMTIQAPMVVPEDRYGLEMSLNAKQLWQQWHPLRGMSYAWTVYGRTREGVWMRHAHGKVHCHVQTEAELGLSSIHEDKFKAAESASNEGLNTEHMYEKLDIVGMNYGPTFRNVTSVSRGERTAVGQVTIPNTKSIMPHEFEFDHLMHPATLDAMFQLLLAIDDTPMVPTTIESIYISTQVPRGAGTTFFGYANATIDSFKGTDATIAMTAENCDLPVVIVKGLHLTKLTQTGFLPSNHNLCTEIQWQEFYGTASTSRFPKLLQLMAHKYPGLSILQCGGDQYMAKHALDAILSGEGHASRLTRYSLTGSNEQELSPLQDAYSTSSVLDLLEHRTLSGNTDVDPKYHLIISATGHHDHEYLMKLLHPDGMLLVRDSDGLYSDDEDDTADEGTRRIAMAYHVDECLKTNHFYVARAQQNSADLLKTSVFILVPNGPDADLRSLANSLVDRLSQERLQVTILTLQDLRSLSPAEAVHVAIISLLELNNSIEGSSPFVWNWTEGQFENFTAMRNLARTVLWVTRGANKESTLPKNAPIIGLARTLMSEDPEKFMVTLDLDEASWIASLGVVRSIVRVYLRSFIQSSFGEIVKETEYAELRGKLFIPRLVPVTSLNCLIHDRSVGMQPVTRQFLDGHMNELAMKGPVGTERESYDNYCFISSCTPPSRTCGPDEIQIEFRASVLQYNDWQTITGATSDTTIGIDLAGVVVHVGSNVKDIQPRDQIVAIIPGGTIKNLHYVDKRFVKRFSAGLRKCVPSAWIQAYYGLIMRCYIRKGQRVLIHHGASPSGQAAIQIASAMGAEVYTTISGTNIDLQRELMTDEFSLDPLHVFDSNDPSWHVQMLSNNGQQKMDVVYNPGPKNLCNTQSILKETGTSVRFADNMAPEPHRPFEDSPSGCIIRLDLAGLLQKEPSLVGDILDRVEEYFHSHSTSIKPVFGLEEYSLSDLQIATAHLKDNERCGGILVSADKDTKVLLPPSCDNRRLPSAVDDGTYVLAGGLGGLGRSIAQRLVDSGARNLVFLSRNPPTSPDVVDFTRSLHKQGVKGLHIAADICDERAVESALSDIVSAKLPPISGVVQATGILKDSLFEKMAFDDWKAVMGPKALGSSNLVKVFGRSAGPTPPWFTFLSSSAGVIGNRGQANYAAGNVFMDALARSGSVPGRAYSLDVGPVLSAGMATESDEMLKKLRASGFYGIRLKDFLSVFERAVIGEIQPNIPMPSQVVLGVGTGGLILQNKPSDPYWSRTAIYSCLGQLDMPLADLDVAGQAAAGSLKSQLAACESLAEATGRVCRALKEEASSKSTIGVDEMDEGKPLRDYGVDSLMAVQIRVWALNVVGASLSIFLVLSDKTILELAHEMAKEVTGLEEDEV